jgi:hypothetical protein
MLGVDCRASECRGHASDGGVSFSRVTFFAASMVARGKNSATGCCQACALLSLPLMANYCWLNVREYGHRGRVCAL